MYFLHKSCEELPLEIRHPFHSQSLFLRDRHGETICNSCHQEGCSFVFHCKDCDFNFCTECILLKPTVKYHGHSHLLCLTEDVYSKLKCNGYETYCKQSAVMSDDFRRTRSYMLRCVECNFNLHLLCGPLPCTVEHRCHTHPLTLYDFLMEDDSDDYYCDSCETKRDLRICVYYCADCKYIAHVHCVISGVRLSPITLVHRK